jgi:hypothetical protein
LRNNKTNKKRKRLTPPCAIAMAMRAAASITHDKGFHINPKNFSILLSCTRS